MRLSKVIPVISFLCLALLTVLSQAQKLTTFSKQYGPFNNSHRAIFTVIDPATINLDALQVTPDTAGDVSLQHLSGRILLNRRFKLWDKDVNSSSQTIASFSSSFLVNVFRKNGTPGEGLTFLIAPDLDLPLNSSDEYLGLTNATTDGDPANRIVAVELDTCKQSFDPDSNHVGLNINSVRSVETASLTPLGIEISPAGAKFYNVWVEYDGVNKSISVYIAEQPEKKGPTPPKPSRPALKLDLDLRKFVSQYSYFGFSASTGNLIQLNCVLKWNLTVQHFQDKHLVMICPIGGGL